MLISVNGEDDIFVEAENPYSNDEDFIVKV